MKTKKTCFARKLRKEQTDAEKIMWRCLRSRGLENCKFKRQYVIEKYIVDFICLEIKLIIEIDGGQHDLQIKQDKIRTRFLNRKGFYVIRYWNNNVIFELSSVLDDIHKWVIKLRSKKNK